MSDPLRRGAPTNRLRSRVGIFLVVIGIGGFAATTAAETGLSPSSADSRVAGSPAIAARIQIAQNAEPQNARAVPENAERQIAQGAVAHEDLLKEKRFPSASTCAACHPKQYKQWSVSQHAYSQLSPVYLSLNNRILELTNGSDGDFCLRCHSQVGANLGESPMISNLKRHATSREGITCIVCHRQNMNYNKVSGRLALVEGHLTDPVFGPTGNAEMKRVLDNPGDYPVTTDPEGTGTKIHKEAKYFAAISTPTFCGTCHDVTLFNGFRLEEAFSEYRMSPAAANGVTCQDCHMGKVQGKMIAKGEANYVRGAAANVAGKETSPRKLTNHFFAGPDYSVIHPGIFPHNVNAQKLKPELQDWLDFDYKAGWGTEKFEDTEPDDEKFPEAWQSPDDRFDAREIINEQFVQLEWARGQRLEVLRNGYLLKDVVVDRADSGGIVFRVKVANGHDGHNSPTGFTGERQVWLKVTVTDRDGKVVYRSGDADPNGDLRDDHSAYVHAHKVPIDDDLFSLQSIFVVQSGRGAELPQVVPIPYPFISLPRVLPSPLSLIFTGEPPTERNHKRGIEPLGHRWAKYSIDGDELTGNGPYKVKIQLRSQMVPVNLINVIQTVGFDYGMSAREVADALVERGDCLWEKEITIKANARDSGGAKLCITESPYKIEE